VSGLGRPVLRPLSESAQYAHPR